MKFFTFIGSGIIVAPLIIFIAIFLYKVLKHRAELVLLLSVVIGSTLLNTLLKLMEVLEYQIFLSWKISEMLTFQDQQSLWKFTN